MALAMTPEEFQARSSTEGRRQIARSSLHGLSAALNRVPAAQAGVLPSVEVQEMLRSVGYQDLPAPTVLFTDTENATIWKSDTCNVAASIKDRGYAQVRLPRDLSAAVQECAGRAAAFFDKSAVLDQLENLNEAYRFYTHMNVSFTDEYVQLSPTREVLTFKRGGFLAREANLNEIASSLVTVHDRYADKWGLLREEQNFEATSLAELATSILLHLVSNEIGGPSTRVDAAVQNGLVGRHGFNGSLEGSRFSMTKTHETSISTPATSEHEVERHVDRGFLTLVYAEEQGLEVQNPRTLEWQKVPARDGCVIVLAGHLLSRLTKAGIPASVHRIATCSVPRLSVVYTLRPPPYTRILWPFQVCAEQGSRREQGGGGRTEWEGEGEAEAEGDAEERGWDGGSEGESEGGSEEREWEEVDTDAIMKELAGSVNEREAGAVWNERTLKEELEEKQRLWVALMMGLHVRLGAATCLEADWWKPLCVDALGLSFLVRLSDAHSEQHEQAPAAADIPMYSAVRGVALAELLAPLRRARALNPYLFEYAVDGRVLGHQWTLERCKLYEGCVVTMRHTPDARVTLVVKGQRGGCMHVIMKRRNRLGGLMRAYCERSGLDMDQLRFLFDGNRLRENQTPGELEMDEGDVIDAMLFQVGD